MEIEKDYFAEIDAWKKRKDDAEYQAKVKAENETWEAQEEILKYWDEVQKICKLADKCEANGIALKDSLYGRKFNVGLILKAFPGNSNRYDHHYCFGYKSQKEFDTIDFLLTENGVEKFLNCQLYKKEAVQDVSADVIKFVLKNIDAFIINFYNFLDEILEK